MSTAFIFLCLQTAILWFLVFFFYGQKARFTLIPLYCFLAVTTLLMHNLNDLGFAISINQWYFLISSFSFFTTTMLIVLFIYLFEGPRATRLALLVVLFTSFFYLLVVFMLGLQVDTSKWVSLHAGSLRYYFWSILAIVVDIIFIAVCWELLGKIKKIPLFVQVFLVIFGTYLLDALIFVTGYFGGQSIYFSILWGDFIIRFILVLVVTPIVVFYLKNEGYKEEAREKPKNFWEIINFNSDLELKLKTMKEIMDHEKELSEELKESEEKYALALDGANAGIWDWDIVRNHIMYSAKFSSLLGFGEGELATTIEAFRKMLHPNDAKRTMDFLDDCLKNKKPYSIDYRLKNKDGSYRWYLSGGITKYDHDKPLRMVGSIIDINEQKTLLHSYQSKVQELERVNKLMVNRELKMLELKQQLKEFGNK